VLRPLNRRHDRIAADLAQLGAETTKVLERTEREIQWAGRDLEALERRADGATSALRSLQDEVATLTRTAGQTADQVALISKQIESLSRQLTALGFRGRVEAGSATGSVRGELRAAGPLPDAFYWRFEAAMRGSPEALERKLRQYEGLANEIHASHPGPGTPLWLDAGCGEGELASLLAEWGWRVLGMDVSASAVRACRERGIDAVEGVLPGWLRDYDGEPPFVISAVQVIEHLDAEHWLPLFQLSFEALQPGGAIVIETINPLNLNALASAFFGDLTHTWPAHPETLRVMAAFAGFDRVEVRYLNEDGRGKPQDYALVGRKP
jgi:SAM-dependent methyltransferase